MFNFFLKVRFFSTLITYGYPYILNLIITIYKNIILIFSSYLYLLLVKKMRLYILSLVIFGFQSTYAKSIASDKANPLLLISLDGVRADMFDLFVAENPKSSFSQLINEGVRATYME